MIGESQPLLCGRGTTRRDCPTRRDFLWRALGLTWAGWKPAPLSMLWEAIPRDRILFTIAPRTSAMTTITAHFDGKFIVPDEPVELPIGQPLRVSCEVAAETP